MVTALDYVECIRGESARFRDAITASTLDLSVVACPGWSVRDLAVHLGEVQRWARLAATTGARPDDADIDAAPEAADAGELCGWLAQGSDDLCDALVAVPGDAPTWHPFPVPKVAAVWPRRQAHEVTIHRWDAQHAAGPAEPIDPAFAVDFIREYFEVIVPRVIDRDGRAAPVGRVEINLTDCDASLHVTSTPTEVSLAGEDAAADGAIEGAASEVLLALWQRPAIGVTHTGPLAERWLEFGGN